MRTLLLQIALFMGFIALFANCKSDPSTQLENDSNVQQADTQKAGVTDSKYLIVPPNDDYTGDYVDKYPNGIIKFTGFFRFGKRHGHWMAFYENGIKWSECFYDNGKKHGSSMVYFPNGKLQYSGWFKNDLRDSLWFFYDEKTGKELDRRAYREDQETGLVN